MSTTSKKKSTTAAAGATTGKATGASTGTAKAASAGPKSSLNATSTSKAKTPTLKPMLGKPQSETVREGAPTGPDLKKQELVAKVVRLSGVRKKDAKPVVEAMLEVLGEAVAEGRELNLKPFGKLKYNRTKETGNARVVIAKIRQNKASKTDAAVKPVVAAAAE